MCHYAAFHLSICCLPKLMFIDAPIFVCDFLGFVHVSLLIAFQCHVTLSVLGLFLTMPLKHIYRAFDWH